MDVLDGASREREIAEQAVGRRLRRTTVDIAEVLSDRLVVLEAHHIVLRRDTRRGVRTPCALRLDEVQRDARGQEQLLRAAQPW